MRDTITDTVDLSHLTSEEFIKALHERTLPILEEFMYKQVDNVDAFLNQVENKIDEKQGDIAYKYKNQVLQPKFKFSIDDKNGSLKFSLVGFKRYELFTDGSEDISLQEWLKEQ